MSGRSACANIFTLTNVLITGGSAISCFLDITLAAFSHDEAWRYKILTLPCCEKRTDDVPRGQNTIPTNRRMEDRGRPLPAVVFWLLSHIVRHKICLQGQSPATYSIWVIGNDNCYILHFQQKANLVSGSVLHWILLFASAQSFALCESSCSNDLKMLLRI